MSDLIPIPVGFGITLDPDTRRLDGATLFGGSPARIMRLTDSGQNAFDELLAGTVRTRAGGMLARRLTDAGIMHPQPPTLTEPVDATIIIPAHDRPEALARCLDALGHAYPVLVVDDGSTQPDRVAAVCSAHDAALIRRDVNGGPAAARNIGLSRIDNAIAVFLDSDCVPPPDIVERLAAHLADPLIAAAAPRITALESRTSAGRYARACGSLYLGDRAGRVAPRTRVAYVPTAALAVRRAALLELDHGASPFDTDLRYGEDVDLEWRLNQAGSRIRYDPTVTVGHDEPDTWAALLARRFRYGTSAGPLARRHPTSMAPFVVHPWSIAAVVAILARRPLWAAAAFAGSTLALARTLRRAGVRRRGVVRGCVTALRQTWLGLGRSCTQLAAPAVLAAILTRGNNGRRMAAASLLIGPPVATWLARRPDLDPGRFIVGHIADDLAYGAGVWTGSIRARTSIPLRPAVATSMVRVTGPTPRPRSPRGHLCRCHHLPAARTPRRRRRTFEDTITPVRAEDE